jgi:hypothetical protein
MAHGEMCYRLSAGSARSDSRGVAAPTRTCRFERGFSLIILLIVQQL